MILFNLSWSLYITRQNAHAPSDEFQAGIRYKYHAANPITPMRSLLTWISKKQAT